MYKNLKSQIDKITRHNNQGSYKTRSRYEKAIKRFSKHLAKKNVKNIKNINKGHITSYANNLKEDDLSPAYIKTELSGIRFYHNKIDNPRMRYFPTNEELEIDKRSYHGINRKWTNIEHQKFKQICISNDKEWIAQSTDLARYGGLRIHEITRLRKDNIEKALRENKLIVKGKGGLVRAIPVNDDLREVLKELNDSTKRGDRVFVKQDEKTHNVIKEIQDSVRENREFYYDNERLLEATGGVELTFHGLRHSYAYEEYQERLESGLSVLEAEKEVSKLLGHSRPEVTRIYLAK